ncbi:hypothetical protein MHB54_00905 [Paenibacillus sp. FSL M7-0802]|jgi:uncharacterized LabA/DUF88 family protein|uniref:hypothetical protein n=1 Tax=Paenibacillus sp. FSL M7-0802 TaxID=2921536 RepID=UPI0030F80D11
MELYRIYEGIIKAMQNTPCKVAVFTDGKNIKVFQKAFYKNNLNRPNWVRNNILERSNVNSVESVLFSSGYKSK